MWLYFRSVILETAISKINAGASIWIEPARLIINAKSFLNRAGVNYSSKELRRVQVLVATLSGDIFNTADSRFLFLI